MFFWPSDLAIPTWNHFSIASFPPLELRGPDQRYRNNKFLDFCIQGEGLRHGTNSRNTEQFPKMELHYW